MKKRKAQSFVTVALWVVIPALIVISFCTKLVFILNPSLRASIDTIASFPWHDYVAINSEIRDSTDDTLPVFIEFTKTPGDEEIALVRKFNGDIHYVYHLVPAIAANVPKENIDNLFEQPSVKTIELDYYGYKQGEDSATTTVATSTNTAVMPNLVSEATSSPTTATTSISMENSFRPPKVSIAILDSGVDSTHPDIAPYYAGGHSFIGIDQNPTDETGHGTHVAGIIINSLKHIYEAYGISVPIKIYDLKVLDSHGAAHFSNIVAALEWAVDHHIDISNNSYGTLVDPGNIVKEAFQNADKAGMLEIASAGNSGACGNEDNDVEYPGRYDWTIAVGAIDSKGYRPCFSSTGPNVDLVAPGVSILSAKRGGGYVSYTGTSMATPDVTAIAAVLYAAGVEDKNSNQRVNDEVRDILRNTAYDLGIPGRDNDYGYGLVNAKTAVEFATSTHLSRK